MNVTELLTNKVTRVTQQSKPNPSPPVQSVSESKNYGFD